MCTLDIGEIKKTRLVGTQQFDVEDGELPLSGVVCGVVCCVVWCGWSLYDV